LLSRAIDPHCCVKNDHAPLQLSATDPKHPKFCVTKSVKQALPDSKSRSKRAVLTIFDEMKANLLVLSCIEQTPRVLMRFFAQFGARRTRLARAKHVNASIYSDGRMNCELLTNGTTQN
jgi:hypothetical protein